MSRTEAWFDRIYQENHRLVRAYCMRRAPAPDVDDAVSEVFAVAWRRRNDVPGGSRTLPWLYGVARRVLSHQRRGAERFRRLKGRVAAVQDPPPLHPDSVVVQRQEHLEVRRAVAQLRPADREVLLLAAWEGLSHREIADVLGCSQAAVDKRVSRAKQRLAKQYTSHTGTETHRPPASAAGGGESR